MLDIRRSKLFVGIMLALILLSFFYVAQENIAGYPEYTFAETIQSESQIQLMQVERSVVRVDRVSAAKGELDEVITREQRTTQVITVRFLVVVCVLLFAVQEVYRIAIRHFGCHMIALWENIIYIHQIDGEKEGVILYTL